MTRLIEKYGYGIGPRIEIVFKRFSRPPRGIIKELTIAYDKISPSANVLKYVPPRNYLRVIPSFVYVSLESVKRCNKYVCI